MLYIILSFKRFAQLFYRLQFYWLLVSHHRLFRIFFILFFGSSEHSNVLQLVEGPKKQLPQSGRKGRKAKGRMDRTQQVKFWWCHFCPSAHFLMTELCPAQNKWSMSISSCFQSMECHHFSNHTRYYLLAKIVFLVVMLKSWHD